MNLKFFQLRSIKTRVTLFTLAIFVTSIWTISFYVGRMLQLDMERALGAQQFSAVSMVAADINEDIQSRLDALEIIAVTIASTLPSGAAATQKALENFPVFQHLFNAGTVVTGLDGTAIASVPAALGRVGVNYMDRDQVATALKEGRSSVGKPVLGRVLKKPILSIAAPIRDPQGKVIGALIGIIDLGQPTFLDKVTNATHGKTGTVSLISVPHRLTVTSSDKKLVLFALPAPGVNPYLDRNMAGFEGSTIVVNVLGQEQLASVKKIPAAQWYLFSGLPIEEVFAPVRATQRRVLLAVILLTLLAGSLTWWMLKRELASMFDTANKLAHMAEVTETPQPLPITRQDEIGELIGGFNRLLETLGRREKALQNSEENLSITLNSIGDAVIATDPAGRVTRMNPVAERLCGWTLADAVDHPLAEVFCIVNAATREPVADPVQLVMAHGEVVGLANHTVLLAKDGHEYHIADSAAPIRNAERKIIGVILVFSDVSQKYAAQEEIEESHERYRALSEAAFEAIFISERGVCLEQNSRAEQMFGYTSTQAIGRMGTEWIAPIDRDLVMKHMMEGYEQPYEVTGLRKDGSTFPSIIRGKMMHYRKRHVRVTSMSDITERKEAEIAWKKSEERLHSVFNAMSEGFSIQEVICDQAGKPVDLRFIEANPAFERQTGVKNADSLGHTLRELFPQSESYWIERYGKVALTGEATRFDAVFGPLNKHYQVSAFQTEPGRFGVTFMDISEIKRAEAALLKSEERWKFAIEGSGDGLWDWSVQTGKAFYSSRYKTMLGFADDEIGDSADEWTKRIHPDDAPGVFAALQPYLDGKPGSATIEFRMLCKDGNWKWTQGRGLVVERDADGKPLRMIGTNSDITERKEHQSQLEHIAHFDALTNLPNRVLLADRLQQAMAQAQRRGQRLAVTYLDLDGFKPVNDRHGHDAGDQVLITLAQRMKQALREGDSLARLGGDEFVAVLIDLEDTSASLPLLNRLLTAAAQPVQVGDVSLQVSASLGVTFYPQAQEIDADQLLRQADQAMYQAKVAGKNRYHIFDATLDSHIRGHYESVERIRLALENHEFVLHYQPKVNMRSGQIIGAEALIRWQHPEKGLLPPVEFLPVIEDQALAIPIGEWVIDTALTQIELWHAAGLDIKVSVNVSARQLQQSDFVDRLKFILAKHPQVSSGSLELEVLETSALEDIAQVSHVIEACAQIGVTFALDDFGTGYSSLTYLKRLRVQTLKIDQSFVRDMLDDPDDLAILQGIIGLAESFKRQVIAEGVETVAHGSLLMQLGCELAQGYGIARPMSSHQLPAWAASWQPDAAWCALPWLGGLDTEW